MKKLLLTIISFFSLATALQAQALQVGTYNIRQRNTIDEGNLWQDRREYLCKLIRYHDFDLLGIQEAFKDQLEDMLKLLPKYGAVGVGRDDGKDKGEHSAILYKKSRFTLIKSDTFWLSDTDTEKPNKGWDAALPRICTWAIFEDKENGKRFIMMNTHFDHVGKVARTESAKLMLQKAHELAKDLPLIITGDLNVDEKSDAYNTFASSPYIQDTYELAPLVYEPNSTFNGWGKSLKAKERIDHIFISKPFNVLKYGVLTDTYMGKFPSDHFPVLVHMEW